MLTADLIAARVVKGEVKPRYVSPTDPAALALAAQMVAVFAEHVGRTREALDGAEQGGRQAEGGEGHRGGSYRKGAGDGPRRPWGCPGRSGGS